MVNSDDWKVKLVLDGKDKVHYVVSGRIASTGGPEELRASLYRVADEIVRQMEESKS